MGDNSNEEPPQWVRRAAEPQEKTRSMLKDSQEKTWLAKLTREDEEDPRDEGKDGPVRPNVADVAQDEANEHEEEADQREGGGRADHLWWGRSREKREQVNPTTQCEKWAQLGGTAATPLL